ncbi:MAG TPA: aldo/keto reductase [Thermoguttaceae bacterium]|nr:aldo/keto reductase [Thermoguttaceae bacterium]
MSVVTRREFLAGSAAAGLALLAPRFGSAAEVVNQPTSGTDLVTLGRSGIKATVLGIGTGTRGGREQRDLGQNGFTKLAREAYDRGIRYIDTADAYMMHMFVRFALEELPREELFIQSKTRAKHPEVAKADIERFRRELQTDYIDSLLMHCMSTETWPTDMRPVMDVLSEAKQKGQVRAVGISCHGLPPVVASIDVDWIDIQLARINPFGRMMDGKPEEVAPLLKKMHQKGRGVIGMKIYGENGLESREQRLESLKYVLGLGCVDAFTIGFSDVKQIDETLALIKEASG